MPNICWKNEIIKIEGLLNEGKTTEGIGKVYGVSRQRIYQILTKFGLNTNIKERKNFLRDKEPKYYWFNKMLTLKQFPRKDRLRLLDSFIIPDTCPILGLSLCYEGLSEGDFSRKDDSPSIDRIDNNKGYSEDNIQIISWRANRIKNNSTPEELYKIATYMMNLTKNKLQL